jgi:hypothetical protein
MQKEQVLEFTYVPSLLSTNQKNVTSSYKLPFPCPSCFRNRTHSICFCIVKIASIHCYWKYLQQGATRFLKVNSVFINNISAERCGLSEIMY